MSGIKSTYLLFILVMLAGVYACEDAPNFSDTPKIEFNNVIFKDDPDAGDADSLIVIIDFEDGDGNLGLGESETQPPFNQKTYYSNKTGAPFNFGSETLEDLLIFDNSRSIDSLPDYAGDAICLYWDTNPQLFLADGTQLDDTVYFQFNPRHNNLLIDFYVNEGDGFEKFEWTLRNDCLPLISRFPILNDDGGDRPLEGTIRYSIQSLGFKTFFKENLVKVRITLIDRAGHYSNTVESPPFRLSDID